MNDLSALATDVKNLLENGHKIVIVHGGAKLVTALSKRVGKQVEFVESPSGM